MNGTHICSRCGYTTTLKSNLKRHLTKLNQCRIKGSCLKTCKELLDELNQQIKLENYLCDCGKTYSHQSSFCRHQRQCEKHFQLKELQRLKETVHKLENNEVKNQINNSLITNGDHNTICNQNIVNNIYNHNTIIVNNFGYEDISYLSQEFIEKCTCILSFGMRSIIKAVYLNEKHPENHTMKVTNIKSSYVHVMKDQKWILIKKEDALNLVIGNMSDKLWTYCNDNKKQIKEKYNSYKINSIERYHGRIENEDKELWKQLRKDVFLQFANEKDMFKKPKK